MNHQQHPTLNVTVHTLAKQMQQLRLLQTKLIQQTAQLEGAVAAHQQKKQLYADHIERAAAITSTTPKEYTDLIFHHRQMGKTLDKINRKLAGKQKILRTIGNRIVDSTQLLKLSSRQTITDHFANNTFLLAANNQIRCNDIALALTQTIVEPLRLP